MTTEPAFQYPEPELVEAVRQGIEAHKHVTREREAQWIAHCQRLLREGDSSNA